MTVIALYGCGGFGREVAPVARVSGGPDADRKILFVSDDRDTPPQINGVSVLTLDGLKKYEPQARVVITVAAHSARRAMAQRCIDRGLAFGSVIARSAQIYDDVRVADGAILCENTIITSNVRIGLHFHSNLFSYVAHDCVIGDYVTFAPRVSCNGNVRIEDNAYIGTGAVLRQGESGRPLVIGKGAVVGMGAVVTKDVPPGTVVVGNPAKPLENR